MQMEEVDGPQSATAEAHQTRLTFCQIAGGGLALHESKMKTREADGMSNQDGRGTGGTRLMAMTMTAWPDVGRTEGRAAQEWYETRTANDVDHECVLPSRSSELQR